MANFMRKLFSNALNNVTGKNVSEKVIGTISLAHLLTKLKTLFVEKNTLLDSVYPLGIVVEIKKDVDPSTTIGGDWQDITDNYEGLPADIKKWKRIIIVDSDKSQLLKSYNQYKDLIFNKEGATFEETYIYFTCIIFMYFFVWLF